MKINKVCANCGKDFVAFNGHRIYCDDVCAGTSISFERWLDLPEELAIRYAKKYRHRLKVGYERYMNQKV